MDKLKNAFLVFAVVMLNLPIDCMGQGTPNENIPLFGGYYYGMSQSDFEENQTNLNGIPKLEKREIFDQCVVVTKDMVSLSEPSAYHNKIKGYFKDGKLFWLLMIGYTTGYQYDDAVANMQASGKWASPKKRQSIFHKFFESKDGIIQSFDLLEYKGDMESTRDLVKYYQNIYRKDRSLSECLKGPNENINVEHGGG
jgi:hypothetical protein